jgi:hypothetical protein
MTTDNRGRGGARAVLVLLMILLPAMVQATNHPLNWLEETARALFLRPIIDTLGAAYRFFNTPPAHGTLLIEGLSPGDTFEIIGVQKDETSLLAPKRANDFILLPPGEYEVLVKGPSGETLKATTVTVEANKVTTWKYQVEDDSLSGRDRLGIGLLAGSLALGGCFVTFGLLSDEQVEKASRLSIGPDKQAWEDEVFTGQLWQVIANSCLVGAVGAIGFGGYLLLTDEEETNEPPITAKFGLFETGFGLKINL